MVIIHIKQNNVTNARRGKKHQNNALLYEDQLSKFDQEYQERKINVGWLIIFWKRKKEAAREYNTLNKMIQRMIREGKEVKSADQEKHHRHANI